MNIAGAVCAVTGAGRGIGRQIASDLAAQGASVYACDISGTALEAFAAAAKTNRWPVTTSVCDVSNESSVAVFFEQIREREHRLNVLVNNAGITRDGLLVKIKGEEVSRLPLADFQQVVNVNLTGVFLCAREAAALMAQTGGGVIVNVSSVSRAGNFGQTNYSATKAGVDAMTVTWAKELARHNIRVAAVAPGYISTEMVAAIKPELREKIVAQVPLKRLGEMREIAHAVRFIIENDFVNGRVLEIDGGLRL